MIAAIGDRRGQIPRVAQHGALAADARIGRTLETEQVLRIGPALALFADAIGFRHFHIVEEHFIENVLAVNRDDGNERDARGVHRAADESDALLLLAFTARARQQEDPVGMLGGRCPYLVAIERVGAILKHGAELE